MNGTYLERGWFEYPANGQRNDPPGTDGWEIYVVAIGDSPSASYALCRDAAAAREFATIVESRAAATEPSLIHKWVSVPRYEVPPAVPCEALLAAGRMGANQVGFAVSRVNGDGSPVSEAVRAARLRVVSEILANFGLPGVLDRWRTCAEGAFYTGSAADIEAIREVLEDFEGGGVSLCSSCPAARLTGA